MDIISEKFKISITACGLTVTIRIVLRFQDQSPLVALLMFYFIFSKIDELDCNERFTDIIYYKILMIKEMN